MRHLNQNHKSPLPDWTTTAKITMKVAILFAMAVLVLANGTSQQELSSAGDQDSKQLT